MAYTTVNKSSDFFKPKLYTGNATDNTAITGVGHQPSFLWAKNATDSGTNWYLIDAVRGVTKEINSNNTDAEGTDATLIKSFNADGFTLGDGSLNQSGKEFISWNWKANNQGSSNTDGTINTTYTSASATSGFSVCQYTGTGANATVGHGMGVAPKMVMVKQTNTTRDWAVYHKYSNPDGTGSQYYLHLNNSDARASNSAFWNNTDPTSSVFHLGSNHNVNGSGGTYIAYCFADVQGFSQFGSYTGNGNADGAFIYTGFAPAFVMVKRTNSTENWFVYDNARTPINVRNKYITVDGTGNSSTADFCDFVSNGFKARVSNSSFNESGSSFLYMAFAEAPLVGSNNTPCTAR